METSFWNFPFHHLSAHFEPVPGQRGQLFQILWPLHPAFLTLRKPTNNITDPWPSGEKWCDLATKIPLCNTRQNFKYGKWLCKSGWLDDFNEPSSRSKARKHKDWEPKDAKLLQEVLSYCLDLPSTIYIWKMLSKDHWLTDLSECKGSWHIKNIFRQKK